MKRVGIIGIIITDRAAAQDVQRVLSAHADIIIGRMGIPDREHQIFAISVAVEGENEEISALTGKLGRLDSVNVKSAVTTVEIK